MQACRVTITTSVDGVEKTINREGECLLSALSCELRYHEENAAVRILLKGETAEIERVGDYSLRLHLERGRQTVGMLGIGGSEGEIGVFAHSVAYSLGKDSLLLSMHYDLFLGGELQKMKLRLIARIKDEVKA